MASFCNSYLKATVVNWSKSFEKSTKVIEIMLACYFGCVCVRNLYWNRIILHRTRILWLLCEFIVFVLPKYGKKNFGTKINCYHIPVLGFFSFFSLRSFILCRHFDWWQFSIVIRLFFFVSCRFPLIFAYSFFIQSLHSLANILCLMIFDALFVVFVISNVIIRDTPILDTIRALIFWICFHYLWKDLYYQSPLTNCYSENNMVFAN